MSELPGADTLEAVSKGEILRSTATIVAAYAQRNAMTQEELFDLTAKVRGVLLRSFTGAPPSSPVVKQEPAVPIEESVQDEQIICLEDGRGMKMLKRHLKSRYNMTPEEYRAKWGLPADYPMVAPQYSRHRSQLARDVGLGKIR